MSNEMIEHNGGTKVNNQFRDICSYRPMDELLTSRQEANTHL